MLTLPLALSLTLTLALSLPLSLPLTLALSLTILVLSALLTALTCLSNPVAAVLQLRKRLVQGALVRQFGLGFGKGCRGLLAGLDRVLSIAGLGGLRHGRKRLG